MHDADVWAPLTGNGDPHLYDSEEEEMGGASAFHVFGNEEKFGTSFGAGVRQQGQVQGGKRTVGVFEISRADR